MVLGEGRPDTRWRALALTLLLFVVATDCWGTLQSADAESTASFETARAYISTWLANVADGAPIITSQSLQETILSDWVRQSSTYEIVSLRKPEDYESAGHIPHAVNMYWVDVLAEENLERFDSGKTLVLYCYYGHASMLVYTILGLLGYPCCSLDFGMMDWNLGALVKDPWDQEADYELETTATAGAEEYGFPDLVIAADDVGDMIRGAAQKYFERGGSPVIRSADVKAIVDCWSDESARYQIADARSTDDYETGHIPNAINIPLGEIAERGRLSQLDPAKTVIVCSENGQMGQLACTILNLLGYRAVNLLFGMMDWNVACVREEYQWDGTAGHAVELEN